MTSLNLLRTLAVLCVVLIHVQSKIGRQVEFGSIIWWIDNLINISSRWAVPILFMLSGALLLDSSKLHEKYDQFYRKRFNKIGIPIIFWTLFYFSWMAFFGKENITFTTILVGLISGRPGQGQHLWFLYSMTLLSGIIRK